MLIEPKRSRFLLNPFGVHFAHMRMSSDALNCINRLALVAHAHSYLSVSICRSCIVYTMREVVVADVVASASFMHAYPSSLSQMQWFRTFRTLCECEIVQSCTPAPSMGCNNTFYIDRFRWRRIRQRQCQQSQRRLGPMHSHSCAHFHLAKSDKWHSSISLQEISMRNSRIYVYIPLFILRRAQALGVRMCKIEEHSKPSQVRSILNAKFELVYVA